MHGCSRHTFGVLFPGAPARCFEDTKQAHMNMKLMSTLTSLMATPWAQYADASGRAVFVNRATGLCQYEKPEAGMLRPVSVWARPLAAVMCMLDGLVPGLL